MPTYYPITGGGAWETAGTWNTASGQTTGNAPNAPLVTDTVVLDAPAGSVSVGAADTCASLTASAYTHTLTVSSGYTLTVAGSANFGASATLVGTGTLALTATGTLTVNAASNTTPWNVTLGGTSQTYTLGTAVTISGNLTFNGTTLVTVATGTNNLSVTGTCTVNTATTFTGTGTVQVGALTGGAFTLTVSSNWTVTGTLTSTGSFTLNGSGKVISVGGNLTVGGNLSGSATLTMNGTGTWSGSYSITMTQMNLAGTITVSGLVQKAGGILTYVSGTVNTSGSTLNIASGSTITTPGTSMHWNNITHTNTATLTLGANLIADGSYSFGTTGGAIAGAYGLQCATLIVASGQTLTWTAGQTLTVTTAIYVNSAYQANTVLQSSSTSINYLAYTGTLANEQIFGAKVGYVNASPSTVPIYNWCGGSLMGTVNIFNVTGAYIKQEGCMGPGTVTINSAQARGGTGYCVDLAPTSTTDPYYWTFLVPTTASTAFTLGLYHQISSGFNGTLTVTVYDTDNATKLVNAASVTLVNDGAYHQYTSGSLTPTATGFCRVVLTMLKGTTGTDIYIDDVTAA